MIVPRHYKEIPQRYRLEGNRCKACGRVFLPPRQICPCGSEDLEDYNLPWRGKILTFTIIRTPPTQFKYQKPYAVAVVELEGGGTIQCQVTDTPLEEIEIGKEVEIVFRKIYSEGEAGIHCYGYKCRLV